MKAHRRYAEVPAEPTVSIKMECPRCGRVTARQYALATWTPDEVIGMARDVHMKHTCVPRMGL